MRRHFRPCFSRSLPILLLLPLTLLPLTPAAAQFNSMGGNGLDSYGYDSGGTYHGSNYGSSPNYMITGPSDADTAALQAKLENDFAFLDRHNDPPPRHSWSDDNDYTPPPPPEKSHYQVAMEELHRKADAGDKDALYKLADNAFYQDKDYPLAVTLYQKAADAGAEFAAHALYHLLLDKTKGVEDISRAAKLLPLLVDHDPTYQDAYGKALIAGDYFPKDAVQGLALRTTAAEASHYYDIPYDLARDYDTGNGIVQDPQQAIHWYLKALESRIYNELHPVAATRVCALMLAQKDGLRIHRDDFVHLLTAADSSLPDSDRKILTDRLAAALAPGEAAPTNPATAAGLLLMSKDFGTPDYTQALDQFAGHAHLPWGDKNGDIPNDDVVALHQLGVIYENGLGVPRDHEKAMDIFDKLVYGGNVCKYGDVFYYRALDELSKWRLARQSGTNSSSDWYDDDDSERDAKDGAELGDLRSKTLYAQWLQYHAERLPSWNEADKLEGLQKANQVWKEASAAGDTQAAYFLGTMAEAGAGTPKDLVAAAKFYRLASDAGNPEAQERYAGYMITGKGSVPKDAAGGQALLEKAAENSPQAANELAVLLWHSPDPKSHGVAIKKLLLKSFDDGYWIAGRNLAKYYHVGLGGIKDEAQARDYLEKAAKRGGKDGAKVAMDAYTKGDCVNADPAAAARWKAVAAGL